MSKKSRLGRNPLAKPKQDSIISATIPVQEAILEKPEKFETKSSSTPARGRPVQHEEQ